MKIDRKRVCGCAVFVVLALGCDEPMSSPDASVPPDGGPSCTVLNWDPTSGTITRWPEPALVVDDVTTETGVRLAFSPDDYPVLAGSLGGYLPTLTEDLPEVDGFGVNAEAYFQFGRGFDLARVPSGDESGTPAAGLGLLVIEPGSPRLQPVIVTATDDDSTLLMAPMQPLPARGLAAAYVTRALTAAAGGCLEASPAMRAALDAPSAEEQRAIDALVSLGAIESAADLIALTVYRTQSIAEDSQAVAQDIATRDYSFVAPPTCVDEAMWRRCEGRFIAEDYRDPVTGVMRRAVGEGAISRARYELPVSLWLPLTPGPHRTMVYGHGLTGGRDQAGRLAAFAVPLGIAVVAIDALEHGEHPTTEGEMPSSISSVLNFFGIGDLGTRALEAARLRDHFRQSTWDKLQLTRLIAQVPDIDGDAMPDLDVTRLAYLGVSLGGLMGPELLATSDDYGAGVLVVPGGRVAAIISDGSTFGPLIELLRPRTASAGDVRRFFPILQTVIERGDPASYGPLILQRRLPGVDAITPSVLVGVVLDDEIVPNVANYALARALGVPVVAPLLRAEPGFQIISPPLMGNFGDGTATAGMLQFDVVGDGAGGTELATHNNIGDSDVGAEAWLDFLESHWDDGVATIRDPYTTLGVPHAM